LNEKAAAYNENETGHILMPVQAINQIMFHEQIDTASLSFLAHKNSQFNKIKKSLFIYCTNKSSGEKNK
jgi:hypothetical protein